MDWTSLIFNPSEKLKAHEKGPLLPEEVLQVYGSIYHTKPGKTVVKMLRWTESGDEKHKIRTVVGKPEASWQIGHRLHPRDERELAHILT